MGMTSEQQQSLEDRAQMALRQEAEQVYGGREVAEVLEHAERTLTPEQAATTNARLQDPRTARETFEGLRRRRDAARQDQLHAQAYQAGGYATAAEFWAGARGDKAEHRRRVAQTPMQVMQQISGGA